MPPESPRIAELRRRVHADPASIAFAQLAEEYRRAGNYEEAVKYCRTGLARHPGYLSARVTLGRALTEIGGVDEAAREFALVLKTAPDNLAAIRGMAEISQRRGDMAGALDYYKRALALARFDPELEETVNRICRAMGDVASSAAQAGLSFEPARSEQKPARPAPPTDLIDFDALLDSLGVPDASPPPMMEMLLSESSVPASRPDPVLPELPDTTPIETAFADLERELRAFDNTPPPPSPEDAVAAVIEELESWVRVLHAERSAHNA